MANDYTVNSLLKAAIVEFFTELTLIQTAYRVKNSPYKGKLSAENTYQVRLMGQILGDTGYTTVPQNVEDKTITVEVQEPLNSTWEYNPSEFDRASGTEDGSTEEERYMRPAACDIVTRAEKNIIDFVNDNVYQHVGTPGTKLNSYSALDEANVFMHELEFPKSERKFLGLTPQNASDVKSSPYLNNNFNQNATKTILNDGYLGSWGEYKEMYSNNQFPKFESNLADATAGTIVTTAVGEGATTITVDFTVSEAGKTVKKGDLITFDKTVVKSVNKVKVTTPRGFQCRVTADTVLDGSGIGILNITPTVLFKGAASPSAYANADSTASTNIPIGTALTVLGSYQSNFAYIRPAIILDWCDMGKLRGNVEQSSNREQGVDLTVGADANLLQWANFVRTSTQYAIGVDPSAIILVAT